MKKRAFRMMTAALAVLMLLTVLPLCMRAVVADGTCGENVTWTLQDGVLTISGSGPMEEFTHWSPAPWKEYKKTRVSSGASWAQAACTVCAGPHQPD